MRTWYKYRTLYLFVLIPKINKTAFSFCKDRKTFSMQNCDILWRDIAPIAFKQLMVEAEKSRKYKV